MGKTVGLTGVWHADIVRKLTDPDLNQKRTMIWIETKGEGAKSAIHQAVAAGAKKEDILVIDINNPKSPLPDYLHHGSPSRSAKVLTEAMKYAFPEGSVMGQAENVLQSAIYLALSIDDEALHEISPSSSKKLNIIDVLYLLVGGNETNNGYERFYRKLQNIAEKRKPTTEINPDSDENEDLMGIFDQTEDHFVEAVRDWDQFNTSKRDRLQTTTSSRNRIAVMRRNKTIWDPNSKTVPIPEIVNSHKIVIINFGSPITSTEEIDSTTKSSSDMLAAMFLNLLWDAIVASCSGWNSEGKGIYIYSDELSMIASDGGDGANIIESMRDQGRSYGVKLNFATQRIDQLGFDTQSTVLSFKHKIYLGTETPSIAEIYVNDLTGGEEGSYTVADIRNLKSLHGITRINIDGQPQPPFNIRFVLPPELEISTALEGWER